MQRNTILYVTIDPFDQRTAAGDLRGHEPNLSRLRAAAAAWRSGVVVQDLWCAHLTEAALEEPSLLALFLSGSYTDWAEAFRQPVWAAELDRFCDLIRRTRVPILAVCGGHQLVAYAYGGWEAVGHMAPAGAEPVAIAEERDGVSRAPKPRVGEVGTFRYVREREDPLFAGLAAGPDDPLVFSQWHMDQVMPGAVRLPGTLPDTDNQVYRCGSICPEPGGWRDGQSAAEAARHVLPGVSLLRPVGLAGARLIEDLTAGPKAASRRHVAIDAECSRVQALRYDAQPAGRILFSTQFHPDLAGSDADGVPDHGIGLLHNFLDIAAHYWAR